jgi:hypothetical protein
MKAMKNHHRSYGLILCATLLVTQGVVRAQSSEAGTSPFTFMELRYDARSIALAGASAALPGDGYGVFSNPATIACLTGPQAVVGYRSVGSGVYGIPIAYLLPESEKGVFGISVCGLTSGNIAATDIGTDGGPVYTGGNAYLDDYNLTLSWAKKIGEIFSAGVNAKGIYEYYKNDGIDDNSTLGIAFDAGCQARFMNSRLIYGFVARNLGAVLSGYDKGYPLPAELASGVSYVPAAIPAARFMIDLDKKRDDELTFDPGCEWEILRNQLFVRGGYSFSWSDVQALKDYLAGNAVEDYTRNNMTGFCCGAGLKTEIAERKVSFDAAVEFLTLALPPNISLSMLVDL